MVSSGPSMVSNVRAENGKGAPCPSGWMRFNSYCYLANDTSRTWDKAKGHCEKLGGELVKIISAEENEFVLSLARKLAPTVVEIWIGLKWNSSKQDFVWSDQSLPTYRNWGRGEPATRGAHQCTIMWILGNQAGKWNDRRCRVSRTYHAGSVCKRQVLNPVTKESTPTSVTPLHNSTLQQKIVDLLRGKSSTNVSTIITKFAKVTNPENGIKLKANELSSSVKMLAQLVIYNSKMNNTAIQSTTDQQNIVQVASNLLEEENTNTWLDLQEIRNNITDDLLKSMDDFGAQVSSRLHGLDNSTTFLTRNIVLRVNRFITRKKLSIDFSQYGAAIIVPAEVFSSNQSSIQASTIVYKTLNSVLRLRKEGNMGENDGRTRFKSGSNIISATILPRPTSPLRKPIKLVFNHKNKSSDVTGKCVFWQIGIPERTWLTRGCVRVDRESNARVTTCECDHLTIFAVLLNNKQVEAHHQPYLQYISTVGCACSLLFLLLTLMVIAFCWKHLKSPRVTMLLHLCTAIAASCILIIVNENKPLEGAWCTVTAALLHYFLLCVFTWMLCHGVMLYLLIIKAEIRDKLKPKMNWLYILGWGFPVSIVALSIAVSGAQSYAANNCWLTLERGLIYWAFVAPVAIIIFVNSVLFIILLCRINKTSKLRKSMTRVQHVKAWLRRSAVLLPVLGVTWSFGLLTFIKSTVLFHYLFTIFNSLQGFVIFFDFCILDHEVRAVITRRLCKRRHAGYINERELELISKNRVQRNNNLQTCTETSETMNNGVHDMEDERLSLRTDT